jgi:hypothetical protein
MAGIPWERFEGEKVGQKYLLGSVASNTGGQAWFHARDAERPGDDIAVVCAPAHKRGWLPSLTELKHPNLRLVLAAGGCFVQGVEIRYCAMEPAGAMLAQQLPDEAPLSVTIVRQMIGHMLGALGALHEHGLVACQLSPASIAHIDGRWKLADPTRVRQAGRVHAALTRRMLAISPCTPPEAFEGVISPSWDVYSLGVTVNLCLLAPGMARSGQTQRLPSPFDILVRMCLDPQPENRLTLADIATILRLPRTDGAARHVYADQEAEERARPRSRALRWLPTGA